MAVTKTTNIDVTAREIDFVTRFGLNWQHLQELLGIMRPIKKEPGTVLKYKTAAISKLESGSVAEGETIPYSTATVTETEYDDITVEKYRKGVTIEAINKWGYDVAIAKTDEAFLVELQNNVTARFYDFLKTGTLIDNADTWQMALAIAKGKVLNKFGELHRSVTDVVGFANVIDAYTYLGAAGITVQTAFGVTYVENFMGYKTLFLLSDSEIPQGKVIATPVDNIDLYYADPGDSSFARAGLVYTVEGQTNLIGFHTEGNYGTAVSDCFALMGMTLFAEYIDGIAVVSVDANPLKGLTVTSETDATTYPWTELTAGDLQSDVEVNGSTISGTLNFIEGGLSPSGPLAGDGYFLALKWSNPDASATSLKVGLVPSASGMDLVECIDDLDRNGVFKISNPREQVFVIQSSAEGKITRQEFKLTGLVFGD